MPRKPGPPKQPATIRFTAGNDPSQRAKPESAPAADNRAPTCPDWLHKDAKMEWKRIVRLLQQMGLMSLAYRAALAGYCQCYARWKQAEQRIDRDGLTVKTPNDMMVQAPWVSVARQARRDMLVFIAEFGLTPATHAKVFGPVVEGVGSDSQLDEYDSYRKSKRRG